MEEAEVSDMRSPENDETVKLRQDDIFRLVQFTEDKRLHNQISDPESEKSVTPPECSKDHGGRCFELRSHLIRTMSSKSTDSIVSDNTFSSIETISSIEEDFCLRQAREITLASRNGDSLSKRSEYLGILRAYDHEFHPEESVRNTDSVPLEFTRERYRKAHVIPHGRAPCDKNEDSEAAKKATIMDVIVGPASSIFHDTYTQSRSPHRTMASGEESISDMIHIVTNDSAMIKDSPCESPLPQLGRMGEISNGTLSSKSVADVHSAAHRSKHHNINLEVSKAARLDKYPRCRNRNGFRFRLGEGTLSEIHRGIAAAGGDDDEDDGDDDNDDDDDYDDDDAVNLHDEYDDDVYPHDGDDGDCDDAQEEKHKADFYGLHCSCFQGYTENDDSDPLFRNRLILNDADDSSTAARRPMMKRRFSKTLHISPRNGESELWTSKWRSSRSSAPQAHLLPEARNVSLKQSNEVSGSKQNECKRWSRNHRRTRGSRRRTLGKGQRILSDQLEESSSGYKAEGESDEQKTLFTNGNLDHHHRRQQHYLHCHPHCLNHHHPRRLQAQVVWSYDMKRDFKEAMMANVQNIVQSHDLIRDIRTATQKVTNLRKLFSVNEKSRFRKSINYAEEALMKAREARFLELLQNYLVLNRRRHHPAIISAFRDVCKHLNE
ncbi:hypothetical protein KP509_13G049500 [Ceratopteris richardii]|nr:hypothetical protein KP509_13G049500 [Ceratopteris richardii]KAH7421290.1 hypothetical protein KP509_13G049500 [Ceratopteris richardii]